MQFRTEHSSTQTGCFGVFWDNDCQELSQAAEAECALGEGETGFVKQFAKAAMSYLRPVAEDLPISSVSDKLLRKLQKTI